MEFSVRRPLTIKFQVFSIGVELLLFYVSCGEWRYQEFRREASIFFFFLFFSFLGDVIPSSRRD